MGGWEGAWHNSPAAIARPRRRGDRMKRRELLTSKKVPSNRHFWHQNCQTSAEFDTLDSSFVRRSSLTAFAILRGGEWPRYQQVSRERPRYRRSADRVALAGSSWKACLELCRRDAE